LSSQRDSKADPVELISDSDKKARREAENGVRQFNLAIQIIKANIPNDGQFKLKQAVILSLHRAALDGIHPLAGTFRNSRVFIGNSDHLPPQSVDVPDHLADLCGYLSQRSPHFQTIPKVSENTRFWRRSS
jgi:Fic family protein